MLHKTIQAVTHDLEQMAFNTAIARLMEFTNFFLKEECRPQWAMEQFVLLASPLAPHMAEELWQALGHADDAGLRALAAVRRGAAPRGHGRDPGADQRQAAGPDRVAAGSDAGRIEPAARADVRDRGVAGRQDDRQGDRGAGADGEFRGEVSDLQTPATRASKSATLTAGAVSKPMPVSLPRATLAFIASLLPGKETMNTRS